MSYGALIICRPRVCPANDKRRLLAEVTYDVKSRLACGYSDSGNRGWALQRVLPIQSIEYSYKFRERC
jgi:hypothetical protein